MKAALCLVLGLAALASAVPSVDIIEDFRIPTDIKERQIFMLKLFNHILEPVSYKEIVDIGRNFKIEENIDLFIKQDVVKTFMNYMKFGFLPRGEVFTIHVDRQLKEVVSMFHMLYYAKDFDTFIRTACWMRMYMNEGMFVYAMTIAVRHREDCKGIILPPPYEIYPYYFVRSDVIQKAYLLKMKKGMLDGKLSHFYGIKKTEKGVYIIDENIFDKRVWLNDEDRLRYFTEDIDLNTYYYYFHVDYPFWMKDDFFNSKYMSRRWEMTMYVYQQILARYYLERLSNGMGDITMLSWYKPIRKGYWPWLMMHNGMSFPNRYNDYLIIRDQNIESIKLIENYESIINEAIIKGFIEMNGIRYELNKPEDIEKLGKIIYGADERTDINKGHIEAYRYMLVLMQSIGLHSWASDKYFVAPTILNTYQTALRDPVFYQLQKRLCRMFILFKMRLPSYTHEDLYFPGVKIDNIVVDKLVTYFDDYFMDMTNAVILNDDEFKKSKSDMTFLVRKRRLNHEPFKFSFDIMSDKTVDCMIRVFIGPKMDEWGRVMDLNRNRVNFVELDSFYYKLNSGKNTIIRNSMDMHNIIRDRMMTRDIWGKINTVNDFRDMFFKDFKNWHTGFPSRLILPKGRIGGMDMLLYVIVSPLKLVENIDMTMFEMYRKDNFMDFRSTVLLDKMPLGFPFDREVDMGKFFTPNMKFIDIRIFHKAQMCDMKTRWDSYVLRNYDMTIKFPGGFDDYFVDDIDVHTNV
ncbi:unnamed protein product [Leptosia nina]|uniref:Uncharacterized protein n=1 Tax=Leptosia nina TaxID=320188 RepID=A0AAV1K238_9NEOP